MVFEVVALLCMGLFAGAALYITLVEHPARHECGTALGLAEFRPSYKRAAVTQASLAALGTLSSLVAFILARDPMVLAAGLLFGLVIPFTVIVILPTNKRLLDPGLAADSPEAAALLSRWGSLHAVRTVVSGLAFVLLSIHMARNLGTP